MSEESVDVRDLDRAHKLIAQGRGCLEKALELVDDEHLDRSYGYVVMAEAQVRKRRDDSYRYRPTKPKLNAGWRTD